MRRSAREARFHHRAAVRAPFLLRPDDGRARCARRRSALRLARGSSWRAKPDDRRCRSRHPQGGKAMTMSYWDGVSWAPEPPPRPSDSQRRARGKRWMLGLLAIGLIAALTSSASPSVLARTVSSMWTAPIGTGGANGTVAFRTYTDGTGSVYIGLRGLKPSTRYGAAITRGGCGTSGADLTAIPSFVTTSTGFVGRSNFLTAT